MRSHMEVVLNQRPLAHRNIYGGILWRIFLRGPGIAENGKVVQVAVVRVNSTGTIWESTNPWLRFVRIKGFGEN